MPSGLKSFLASLFSPMVLRYAVPALGLIVVAVVGVFVMNQNRPKDSVAQLTDADQNKAAQAGRQAPEAPAAEGFVYDSKSANKPDARERESVAGAAKDQTANVAAPVTRDAPGVVANQPAEATGTAAAEAPPPPAPKPAAQVEDEAARAANAQKEKKAATQPPTSLARGRGAVKDGVDAADKNEAKKTETVTVTAGAATRKDIVVRPAKSPETTDNSPQESKRAPAQEKLRQRSRSEESSEERESDSAGETRTVAGRRFKKSGRVWIDTAFISSKPITTVTRGSEQYRALVADEPSIRKIADELDGEIVVVWKGSTYRIR